MGIDVFISYHTESSRNIVEAIVNKLESVGIRCWYAPRDVEGAYAGSITAAIKACSVFVLVLNRSSSESPHVLNELELITGRLAAKEAVSIIPFHVADKEISDDAKYYISRMHWLDAVTPPLEKRIDELAGRVRSELTAHGCGDFLKSVRTDESLKKGNAAPTAASLVSTMPSARDIFVGRERFMEEIDDRFRSGKRVLFLEGIGGIGKSELAKNYASEHKDEYDTVIFAQFKDSLLHLVCSPNEIIINGFTENPAENERQLFERKLRLFRTLANERTLLIIDNFDVDDDPDLEELIKGSHRVILTTRNHHPGRATVIVNAITDEITLTELFEKNLEDTVEEGDRQYLCELFKLVSYHTYTIELLAKQMKESFLSCRELCEMFKNGQLASMTEDVPGRSDSKDTAFGHIRTLFAINRFTESELCVMRELSLAGVGGIPKFFFFKWSSCEDVRKAVRRLLDRSLVRCENGEFGQSFALHPLMGEVVRYTDELKPTSENCRGFLEHIADSIYMTWYMPLQEKNSIADCVLAIADNFAPFRFEPGDRRLFSVWAVIPSFLWQVGKFEDSIRIGRIMYDTCLSIEGEKSLFTGFAAKTLAGCYFNSRRTEESIEWYKRGLYSMQGCEENEDTQIIYEKVARCCTWEYERDFEKAQELFEMSLKIGERLIEKIKSGFVSVCFEEPVPSTASKIEEHLGETYMEMGRMYQLMGDYREALEYIEKDEEIIHRTAPDNVSGIAYVHFDKGVCHYNLGHEKALLGDTDGAMSEYNLAIEDLSKALEMNKRMRGNLAADTIDNEELLGDAYAAVKKNDEARYHYAIAYDMNSRLFGCGSTESNRLSEKLEKLEKLDADE